MNQLAINLYFKSLIPPLSDDEFRQLEESILSQGCRDAIKHWKGVILDGHNRYAICQKHGLGFKVEKLRFSSKQDAAVWIIDNQLGRRNLSSAALIKLALEKIELLRNAVKQGLLKPEPIHVHKLASRESGQSVGTVHKYMKVRELGSPELVQQVDNGEIRIGTAYRMIKKADEPQQEGIVSDCGAETINLPGLEVTTRTVEVLYSSDDAPDIRNPYVVSAMVNNMDVVGRMYQFVGDNAGFVCLGDEVGLIRRRLAMQLERVDGMLQFADNRILLTNSVDSSNVIL